MFSHTLSPTAELRTIEPWQAQEFAEHMDRAREHIRPWVSAAFVTVDVDGARATLTRFADRTASDGGRIFGIWENGVLIGGVMYTTFVATAAHCELGCWLEPGAEGRGLVTTACKVLLDWAFTVRGIRRIEWQCRDDNALSVAVAKRLGMTYEGTLRDEWKFGDDFYGTQVWSRLSTD
jgi:RimJ/RimL family protein N-acetyltransferase